MRRLLRFVAVTLLALPSILSAQHPDTTGAPRRDTTRLAEIRVVGNAAALAVIPGSAEVVDRAALARWQPHTFNEVLRRVPGLVARDEEGLGLRPNIGVRGLSPTRSSKILLLEDGIPLTMAPYGDNASYYHPPVDRFDRIEVLKGSGQILFGPQTVGGVINYITPAVPLRLSGALTLSGGSAGAFNGLLSAGGTHGALGGLLSYEHKQADGSRAAISSRLEDLSLKGVITLDSRQALTVRANWYRERSNVTYSGLTESEWAADPRQNPFVNDSMLLDRVGGSLTHRIDLGARATLTTTAYANGVRRHWWRQSSNSAERPNDSSDPACGGMANLSTTCGIMGRLRAYLVTGVEPRLHASYDALGMVGTLDAGLRVHAERQDRRQINADAPTARTAGTSVNGGQVEDNLRTLIATSAFVQNRFLKGRWSVTPGLRVEHIDYHRVNRLANPEVGGRTSLTRLVPGLGATVEPSHGLTLFAGVHRGFAPPRTEDVIDNATGQPIELDPELSWNAELGARAEPARGVALQGTLFRLDFENQIVPASVAGGTGASLTNAGRTLQQGLELSGRVDLGLVLRSRHNVFVQTALTWLPTARFAGTRFAWVGTGGSDVVGKVYAAQNAAGTRTQASVTGRRLPYAPIATLTTSLGYAWGELFDARIEAVAVGRQYGDALNTLVTVADGQQGVIAPHVVWNAAASWRLERTGTAVFVTGQNLFDWLYLADRTRGLVPGPQRTVQAGISQTF